MNAYKAIFLKTSSKNEINTEYPASLYLLKRTETSQVLPVEIATKQIMKERSYMLSFKSGRFVIPRIEQTIDLKENISEIGFDVNDYHFSRFIKKESLEVTSFKARDFIVKTKNNIIIIREG